MELEDAESGESILVDTGSAAVRRRYEQFGDARAKRLKELFRTNGVDQIEVATSEDYVRDLVRFFRTRERKSSAS